MTPEFKKAVLTEAGEKDWQPIYREFDGRRIQTNHEWAEVCFVPNAISHSKNAPVYRYLAIREAMGSMDLPGMPQQEFPFQTLQMDLQHYKLFGLVTNMDWDGERLIHWHRERCGKSEEAQHDHEASGLGWFPGLPADEGDSIFVHQHSGPDC